MEIFGHEYGLLYSVGAMEELKEHCPDHDLNKLGRLLDDAQGGKEMLCIMSRWHEKAEAMKARLEGREYQEHPLEMELLDLVPMQDFNEMMGEAVAVMFRDREQTVETEEPTKNGKKKEAPAEKSS
jgi:hypothetical protein